MLDIRIAADLEGSYLPSDDAAQCDNPASKVPNGHLFKWHF